VKSSYFFTVRLSFDSFFEIEDQRWVNEFSGKKHTWHSSIPAKPYTMSLRLLAKIGETLEGVRKRGRGSKINLRFLFYAKAQLRICDAHLAEVTLQVCISDSGYGVQGSGFKF